MEEATGVQTQEQLDFSTALQRTIKAGLFKDTVAKGLNEVCKAIDNKNRPVLCIVADDCNEEMYLKLVKGLCKENKVPLIHIAEGLTLGKWVGQCKYDAQLNPRKVKRCSSLVIKAFVNEEDEAAKLIKERIANESDITL